MKNLPVYKHPASYAREHDELAAYRASNQANAACKDARGNLVRIENALDKMPERLRSVQEQLENLYNQQAAAKAEVGKPFPQEQELAAKTARLIELDMELNLDGKGQPQPEQAIAKSARPSVLDRLKAPPVHGAPEKPHKKEMEAR